MSNKDIALIFASAIAVVMTAFAATAWIVGNRAESRADKAQSALVRSQEAISEAGVNLPAQKAFDYSNEYPAPFNIKVTCTHRGAPGKLSPDASPKPGDRLIRDCIVTRIGPSG